VVLAESLAPRRLKRVSAASQCVARVRKATGLPVRSPEADLELLRLLAREPPEVEAAESRNARRRPL